jgi:hypothetical protein
MEVFRSIASDHPHALCALQIKPIEFRKTPRFSEYIISRSAQPIIAMKGAMLHLITEGACE